MTLLSSGDAYRRREAAAAKYRPDRVKLLLVAEAPPCTLDRYFYFEDVQEQDSLFRYVYKGIASETPTRERKREHLARLRDAGVYLIDVTSNPIADGAKVRLQPDEIAALPKRCADLKPDAVVLIKSNVYDECFASLRTSGLNVIDRRMPFPGSGQQRKFEAAFADALRQADFR